MYKRYIGLACLGVKGTALVFILSPEWNIFMIQRSKDLRCPYYGFRWLHAS